MSAPTMKNDFSQVGRLPAEGLLPTRSDGAKIGSVAPSFLDQLDERIGGCSNQVDVASRCVADFLDRILGICPMDPTEQEIQTAGGGKFAQLNGAITRLEDAVTRLATAIRPLDLM